MNSWTLIRRSLRFHARAHLGVVLGAAVGSAALVGALVVGDSVRGSLTELALARLGRVQTALVAGDRLFQAQLAASLSGTGNVAAAVLLLPGTAASGDASARANQVQVLGVDERFWALANQSPAFKNIPADGAVLNEPLAAQLRVKTGDTVVLRVKKPSLISRDAPLTPQEDFSVALRLKISAIVTDEQFGRFGLQASQVAPFNAFVDLTQLQEKTAQTNHANLMVVGGAAAGGTANAMNESLKRHWQLADAELELRATPEGGTELSSDRIFLDPPVIAAAERIATNAQPIITYFVNELRVGDHATPYSMVTAMGAPVVPADMRDDEIIINEWLAEDLQAKARDRLWLTYYVIGNGRALEQRTNSFRIRAIIPLAGAAADRTLMPDFPGIAQAESARNWDSGLPIQLDKIRDKDEQYWHEHRGTPKAFVTLAEGRRLWANRFGEFTAIRFSASAGTLENIRSNLVSAIDPAGVGLSFQPVREQALAASSQATDFGGLFIGFSFFLIAAALLLMALLFQFGLEQRATEIGTLLAVGFRPRQVRRLLLAEGALLAFLGGIIGMAGGVLYARAMLRGLTTDWRGAVGTSALHYHAEPATLVMGAFASSLVAALTIWLALRRQGRRPARELLALGEEREGGWMMENGGWKRSRGGWIGTVAAVFALAMVGGAIWKRDTSSAETFFSAGALLLIAGLGFAAAWLGALGRSSRVAAGFSLREPSKLHDGHVPSSASPSSQPSPPLGEKVPEGRTRGRLAGSEGTELSLSRLGLRGSTRRRRRSLATIALLACGVFLIAAIGAFRQDANVDAARRSSGTGGFALIGHATMPVTYDLNGKAGRDFYGLKAEALAGVSVVPFRVRDGDDASCLNLNRAQKPRLLGVNPEALQTRKAFTFAEAAKGLNVDKGWLLLKCDDANQSVAANEIPAIGDSENSILWAMGKKVGDAVDYTDEQGRAFKLRLVAAVANSVLQGNLIIDEAAFIRRFPSESGYRMFLIDAPSNSVAAVSAMLSRSLSDAGLELTPAAERLNAFNAVQNTYLNTFQVLGGLGLLLGSAGLGVVVLRNVQERRGELGLLLAVGFRRRALHWLVLSEHGALLGCGLAVGVIAAAVGVLPALISPGSQIPYASLALTLGAVLANGLVWAWLATRFALRGNLLEALRNN